GSAVRVGAAGAVGDQCPADGGVGGVLCAGRQFGADGVDVAGGRVRVARGDAGDGGGVGRPARRSGAARAGGAADAGGGYRAVVDAGGDDDGVRVGGRWRVDPVGRGGFRVGRDRARGDQDGVVAARAGASGGVSCLVPAGDQ